MLRFKSLIAVVLCLLAAGVVAAQTKLAAGNAGAYVPIYPKNMSCGKVTSAFRSMLDLDGSTRSKPHIGIDFGKKGDTVIAPADGIISAIWDVDQGWGRDWNVLLIHTTADLNLPSRSVVYYTEFDHLQRHDMRQLTVGARVHRGDPIGIVRHPGNNQRFRPEVHMEVYEIPTSRQQELEWHNDTGFRYWFNGSAKLVDPLEMMSMHMAQPQDGHVRIALHDANMDQTGLSGFIYPLLCSNTGQ